MSLIDLITGQRGKPSEGLGGFDQEREGTDLSLHVANCAKRYDDLRASIDSVRILLWLIIALLLASNVITVERIVGLLP